MLTEPELSGVEYRPYCRCKDSRHDMRLVIKDTGEDGVLTDEEYEAKERAELDGEVQP